MLSVFRVRRDPYGYNGQGNIMEEGVVNWTEIDVSVAILSLYKGPDI